VDTLTPTQRSERMSRVRHNGSAAERFVRSLTHRLGYRFRLHGAHLPASRTSSFPSGAR
jgi:DNA mismatch endonuclease (patch repair protein)